MSEPGLYALTKIIAGGLSAVLTGPMGSMDLPDVNLSDRLTGSPPAYTAEIATPDGARLGWLRHGRPGSPRVDDLPETFIQALLSIEDAHFGQHPGVDPAAVISAGLDTLRGRRRGGSTITQQLIKNTVTGAEQTIDRKIREGIIAVRAQSAHTSEEILQAYLASAWFGRGQMGAAGAALAWFGKPWDEIRIHEAAFLAGILKGPAYYDPIRYPDRARARTDLVLARMHERGVISATELAVAQALPIEVIPEEEASDLFDQVPHWVASGVSADLDRYGLMSRSDIASGHLEITTTISPDWQALAEEALAVGIARIGTPGPAATLRLPAIDYGDPLSGGGVEDMRRAAAKALATTSGTGRAIVHSVDQGEARVIIDRGFGPLEWDRITLDTQEIGYEPSPGDVLAYRRIHDAPVLLPLPQVQGAVIVMDPTDGAILASVGGSEPELLPFDRTEARRQPGSSLKPFLWARAMEEGLRYDDLVEDVERSYVQTNGQIWRPRNYDRSQSGLIPLFVGLEESSNLVAANLVDKFGIFALAEITEMAGIYDWGGMRRHMSSALGASETSLTRMAAGYAALANGGHAVMPHRIGKIERDGQTLWTPPGADFAIASRETVNDITSMLYGVTRRGTAHSAFRGFEMPVAGKTGTTEDYRDAWFMSYTPGVVVGVWIGRDDFAPIPGNLSGSRAAAPVARHIYEMALARGLLEADGHRPGQDRTSDWPPRLLKAGHQSRARRAGPRPNQGDPFKRQVSARPLQPQGQGARIGLERNEGYLETRRDPNAIFSSSESGRIQDSGPIFRTPW